MMIFDRIAWIKFESPTVVLDVTASHELSEETHSLKVFVKEDGTAVECEPGIIFYLT